jgi:hypothetical protein
VGEHPPEDAEGSQVFLPEAPGGPERAQPYPPSPAFRRNVATSDDGEVAEG